MDWVSRAEKLATAAHEGAVDKDGVDYITHPARVVQRVDVRGLSFRDAQLVQAVAWVHDVVEDTDWSVEDVADFVMEDASDMDRQQFVSALDAVSARRHERRSDYYARVAADRVALLVKRADIADNSDEARLVRLPEQVADRLRAKYGKASRMLDELSSDVLV